MNSVHKGAWEDDRWPKRRWFNPGCTAGNDDQIDSNRYISCPMCMYLMLLTRMDSTRWNQIHRRSWTALIKSWTRRRSSILGCSSCSPEKTSRICLVPLPDRQHLPFLPLFPLLANPAAVSTSSLLSPLRKRIQLVRHITNP